MRHSMYIALVLAASAGCFFGGQISADGSSSGSHSSGGADGVSSSSGQACGDASTGLPADITTLLQQRCQSCHGSSPSDSVPMSMVTYDDLMAAAPSDSSQSVAQLSLRRMSSESAPMPPGTGVSVPADALAAFQAWVDAGTPRAAVVDCDGASSGGGSSGTFDTPTVCTSGTHWTSRKDSADMNPGRACIDCHQREHGSSIVSVGGTVYATAHEPDLCDGAGASGAKVVITDDNGKVFTLAVGQTGNFSQKSRTAVAFPIHAKVVAADGTERAMIASQTTGDCNSCHTESGTADAPGRIMLP